MNILTCIKQVPNTAHMTIDPVTHRLVRNGVSTILNPADRYTLERALLLHDQYGGNLTVLTMGNSQAMSELVSAYLVGADHCILLSDSAFGGSDTFATASVIAAAVQYEQERTGQTFDLILCGKETIDGETGQVGPELAQLLDLPYFTNISRMDYNENSFLLEYTLNETNLQVKAQLPFLATFPFGDDVFLRRSLPERLETKDSFEIPILTHEDLAPWLNLEEIGLNGSATRVVRSYIPSIQRKCVRIDQGTPAQKAAQLVTLLREDGLLTQGNSVAATSALSINKKCEKGNGRITVFVEQNGAGSCKELSLELLTPALSIGNEAGYLVNAVLIGSCNQKAINELSHYGIDEIISLEHPVFSDMQVNNYAQAFSTYIDAYHPEGIIVGSTVLGKELAARIASTYHTGLTAECTGIQYNEEKQSMIWSRPAYGGKLMADIICQHKRPQMGTVREGVFTKPEKKNSNPAIIAMPVEMDSLTAAVTVLNKSVTPLPPQTTANTSSIIVGMGRGIRNMDGFDICCDFADTIGAEIGSSRGGLELRLMSQQYLIGSNGKTVRPDIYFACGISGALQHMTGINDSKCIVAINNNPTADIFQYADYCLVGDLFQIIPALQDEMENIL